MKKVSGSLKLSYSQYRELQSFSQFGSDLDKDTKERLAKGERIVEVLKQDRNKPVAVEHQVIIIYAVTNNYLKDIDVKNIADYQIQLFDYIDNSYPEIIDSIKVTKELTAETENALKEALTLFADKYISDEK
jgi:F-type H+-transporting ATPase subunit alpha